MLPTLIPFTFHWKLGALPPLVSAAVKITEVPAQILVPWLDVIVTVGKETELTVIEMLLLLALVGFGQAALLVKIQDTTSPLNNEFVE